MSNTRTAIMFMDKVYPDKVGGGSGGTEVIPNPSEEPTTALETIQIEDTVYNIPGGLEPIEIEWSVYNALPMEDKLDPTKQYYVKNIPGGEGGASALSELTDVQLTDLTNNQGLKYDSTIEKWINTDIGGGNANIVELTQAEYDALPDTKLSDDVLYMVHSDGTPYLDPAYTYITYGDNDEIIIRIFDKDGPNEKTLWFFNGFTKAGSDWPVPSELQPYLPNHTTCASVTYDSDSSTTQTGWIGFHAGLNPYEVLRTWTIDWGSLKAGTFYAVVNTELGQYQQNEYTNPYIYKQDNANRIYLNGKCYSDDADLIKALSMNEYNLLSHEEKMKNTLYLIQDNKQNPNYLYRTYNFENGLGTLVIEYTQNLSVSNWYFNNVYITNTGMDIPTELLDYLPTVETNVYRYTKGWDAETKITHINSGGIYNEGGTYRFRLLSTNLQTYITGTLNGWVDATILTSGVQDNAYVDKFPSQYIIYKEVIYNNSSGGGSIGGASALEDLEDVELTSPIDGQVLTYDATNGVWINASASGGGSFSDLTSAEYEQLTPEQKQDPDTLYLVDHTGQDVPVLINETNATAITVSGGSMGHSLTETSTTITWNGGGDIGRQINYLTPIDVTNIDEIKYDLVTTTCYGHNNANVEEQTNTRFQIQVVVVRNINNSNYFVDITPSPILVGNIHKYTNTTYIESECTLDVSNITGTVYIEFGAHGWNCVLSNLRYITKAPLSRYIKYKDITYANLGNESGGSVSNHFHVFGDIIKSGTGTTLGTGQADISIIGEYAYIYYEYELLSQGSDGDYHWGLSATALKEIDSNIPDITPLDGGYWSPYGYDSSKMNYAPSHKVLKSDTWTIGRYYDITDPTSYPIGCWDANDFGVGTHIIGMAIGQVNNAGGGGGGGSEVEPNPQGTPIDTLNTIGINGTIYDIASSGGGEGYTNAVILWEGDFVGDGSFVVPNLSDWLIVGYCNYTGADMLTTYMSIGTPARGGELYGEYGSGNTSTYGHRFGFNASTNTLTVSNENRGLYFDGNTTHGGGSSCHIYAVVGLVRKVGANGDIFAPIIYSTEEREVGCWTDGKPLYQKTFEYDITSTIQDGETNLIDFPNVAPVDMEGFIVNKTDGRMYPLTYDYGKPTCLMYTSAGKIQMRIAGGDSWGTSYKIIITMRYTKNSDSAGSGSWTPSGVPAVHYSTSEQVIGTWIDGSVLYQKTFSGLSVGVAQNSWTDTGCAIANGAKAINSIVLASTSQISAVVDLRPSENGKIYVMGFRNATPVMKQLVIQYVKAT